MNDLVGARVYSFRPALNIRIAESEKNCKLGSSINLIPCDVAADRFHRCNALSGLADCLNKGRDAADLVTDGAQRLDHSRIVDDFPSFRLNGTLLPPRAVLAAATHSPPEARLRIAHSLTRSLWQICSTLDQPSPSAISRLS